MKKTAVERLEELLNAKDEEIEKLRERNQCLESTVEASTWGWREPRDIPDLGLPVPRLELFVTPRRNKDYFTGTLWIRRLVVAAQDEGIVGLPITAATSTYCYPQGRPSISDKYFPTALIVAIEFDAGHLGLPAYRVIEYWKTPKSKPTYEAKLIEPTIARGSPYDQGLTARKAPAQ